MLKNHLGFFDLCSLCQSYSFHAWCPMPALSLTLTLTIDSFDVHFCVRT